MSASTETSFYNLHYSPKDALHSKIFYLKDPVRAYSTGDEKITLEPSFAGNKQPPKESKGPIEHKDIEVLWKTGNYDLDINPFKQQRLTNLSEINKYYLPHATVPYKYDVPLWTPTDKIA